MSWLKKTFRKILKEYDLYWIYESQSETPVVPIPPGFEFGEISGPEELHSAAPEIDSLGPYLLADSRCFVVRKGSEIVSGCVYWWGDTYAAHRNFWSLRPQEAKLVQISTVPSCRGLGLASGLISHSATHMRQSGFQRLFARVWHSNAASIRTFEKARWIRIAFRARFQLPLLGQKTFTRRYKR